MLKDVTKRALAQSAEFNHRSGAENFDVLEMAKAKMRENFNIFAKEKAENEKAEETATEEVKTEEDTLIVKFIEPNGRVEIHILNRRDALALVEDLGEFRHLMISDLIGGRLVKIVVGKERMDPENPGQVLKAKIEPEAHVIAHNEPEKVLAVGDSFEPEAA